MDDWGMASATELTSALRSGAVGSLELTEAFISRIETHDGELNAVVVRDFERARQAARRADETRSTRSDPAPLRGLPITIKESYDVAGLPTTWGFERFAENVAERDSIVVAQYRAAGAILLGKTNVPVALADFQSYNPIYGTTNNPWDHTRTPGGSSGGAAAALAAGLTALEAGSDIGGSIRNPAHFCGVYGHKPSYGIVPQQGHALPGMVASPDLAVCGPLARSAEDLALAFEILAQPEPLVAPGWTLTLPASRRERLTEFRVAIWPTHGIAPVAAEVEARVRHFGESLRRAGVTVSDSARPDFDVAKEHETYLSLLNAELGATLPPTQRATAARAAATSDPEDRSNATVMTRATVLSHAEWLAHHHRRERLRYVWREFFRSWDILVCPQMPTTAYPHDHRPFVERTLRVDDREQAYFDQLFWSGLATASYLPSTVFPTGLSRDGLPIGLQAIGAAFDDRTTLAFSRLVAQELGGFVAPPGYA